jgi:hypothetical protein
LSIVTIIIDEKRSQPLKLQQQHNKLYRKLMKGLVETVRQPYTTFKRIQKVLETLI